ncbi:MAG: glutathione S-transferase [Pseudomonadota bacterium]
MTYHLAIGDRSYSSWSLRAWLLFAKWNIPVRVETARIYTDELPTLLQRYAPSRLVPAMKRDGVVTHDTLAIAETLAEDHITMWPTDAAARAHARSMTAEMHSGFPALRLACPMNLLHGWDGFAPAEDVLADCARIETLWSAALQASGGPWLFGDYTVADAFYAPVATRFATYGLPRGGDAGAYIAKTLADGHFRRWRAMGVAENYVQTAYDMGLPHVSWSGPTPIPAQAVSGSDAENDRCPYSGDPVTDVLEIDGRRIGFCNPFCRDKTVADPAAWPAFMAIYEK